ncbi:MAG: 50S ribosomal protein L29 [bacterium]|nr:50S ribosomal protein L29 [bacterium]
MKAKELRQIAPETLKVKVEELRAQIEQMRFGSAKGSEKNVKKLSMVRHELARCLTVLHESRLSPSRVEGSTLSNVEGLTILTEHENNSHSSTK